MDEHQKSEQAFRFLTYSAAIGILGLVAAVLIAAIDGGFKDADKLDPPRVEGGK